MAVVLASDLEQTGSFAASDARLNRLHQNVVWSQRGNFLSVPTDCPQRERAGWTGDIQAFVGAASNNAQVVPFLSRWLDNLRADQLPDGRIPIFSPRSPFDAEAAATAQGIGSIVAAAGWSDAIAIVPWVLYERYGDRRVLEENYDAMLRWIEYQRVTAAAEVPEALVDADLPRGRRRAQALLYNTGEHFGDWLTPSTMEGKPDARGDRHRPRADERVHRARCSRRRRSRSPRGSRRCSGEKRMPSTSPPAPPRCARPSPPSTSTPNGDLPVRLQGVYVLALAFDMVPADRRPRAAARLVELIRARGDRLDTGFLSTPYLLDVLCDHGYPDVARALLWQSEMPSWLYEVDHGATTIWEAWDAISPDGEIRADVVQPLRAGERRRLAVPPGRRHPLDLPRLPHRRDRARLRRGRRPRARRTWARRTGGSRSSGRGRGMRHPSPSTSPTASRRSSPRPAATSRSAPAARRTRSSSGRRGRER